MTSSFYNFVIYIVDGFEFYNFLNYTFTVNRNDILEANFSFYLNTS